MVDGPWVGKHLPYGMVWCNKSNRRRLVPLLCVMHPAGVNRNVDRSSSRREGIRRKPVMIHSV